MPIKNFDYQEFTDNMLKQAHEQIPPDLKTEDINFVLSIMRKFSLLTGEAINAKYDIGFDVGQAQILCQFVAEWTFHKSIDLARAKVPTEYREGILQKVAYVLFETAENMLKKKIPQEEIIPAAENCVNETYEKVLDEYFDTDKIGGFIYFRALKESNIDKMTPGKKDSTTGFKKIYNALVSIVGFFLILTLLVFNFTYHIGSGDRIFLCNIIALSVLLYVYCLTTGGAFNIFRDDDN